MHKDTKKFVSLALLQCSLHYSSLEWNTIISQGITDIFFLAKCYEVYIKNLKETSAIKSDFFSSLYVPMLSKFSVVNISIIPREHTHHTKNQENHYLNEEKRQSSTYANTGTN